MLDENGFAVGIVTRSDVAVKPRRKVALVDHNEFSQAVDGLKEQKSSKVVDHHRIGDVSTNQPIHFTNVPRLFCCHRYLEAPVRVLIFLKVLPHPFFLQS